VIVLLAGLPGSGKSTLARALAERLPAAVLDKDLIRAALFQPGHVEYTAAQDDFCQELMLQTAAYLLTKSADLYVFLDGRTFSRRYQRDHVIAFCNKVGTAYAVLECVCTEPTAQKRLAEALTQHSHPAENRTPALYGEILKIWEPIELPKLVINTEDDLESCADRALKYLIRTP
jgi:predicted kinase